MGVRLLRHTLSVAVFILSLAISFGQPARAALPLTLAFTPHAEFFSIETHQPTALDPHAFVRDPSAPAATGPQNIEHAAGYRPAFLSDAKRTPVFTAAGKPLGFSLGQWIGAKGAVTITPLASGGARISARFTGLRPNGVYSLFENHFDQQPVGFTPLDGTGKSNSLRVKSDGTAAITVIALQTPTHANAVLLVYHSDHRTHGDSRGEIGINVHHQLIARPP